MSIDPYKIAQQVLEPGEKLLWAGRPEVRAYVATTPSASYPPFGTIRLTV